jgi:DedD protein
MGLFSFLGKNKQDNAEASGRFSRADDDAVAERARSKRASHAGGRRGDDPVLPEKKRARRRLVGAIALALAAAVGLPMLLDSEPKPLAGDIAIQIPSKDKAPPLPVPSAPAPAPAPAPSVAAADSVDKGEEIVAPPAARPAAPAPAEATREVAEVRPAAKAEPAKLAQAEHVKADAPRLEHVRPEARPKESRPEPKPAEKPKADKKPDDKPHARDDSARALAILEGQPADKADKHDAAATKVVLQVAALGSQEKVAELQARLREAGIHSFTQKYNQLIRVKVGPYSKEEAEKVRAQLSKLGLSGTVVPA